ncbi:MAG: hypothetical protein C0393_00630 [Anaerolinea sp.]|nr:hypothetical protein [Anaerolinea sp.]
MIICPDCQHKDFSGALFCSQCGAQLVAATSSDLPSGLRQEDPMTKISSNSKQKTNSKPAPPAGSAGEAHITLHLVESGQILPLAERMEFSLGRVSEGQPIMPDIDLTPYKAYDKGVSRLHAILRRVKNRIVIMDLGSSNGTYVNGIRLLPQVEHVLAHGDTIHLGKLKIQILFSQDK